MSLDEDAEEAYVECTDQVWIREINARAKIHADHLREYVSYFQQYKRDVQTHGVENIKHLYNHKTGEFTYEVNASPTRTQQIIEERTGVKKK